MRRPTRRGRAPQPREGGLDEGYNVMPRGRPPGRSIYQGRKPTIDRAAVAQ